MTTYWLMVFLIVKAGDRPIAQAAVYNAEAECRAATEEYRAIYPDIIVECVKLEARSR